MESAAVETHPRAAVAAPLATLGRIFYALPMVAFGVLHFVLGNVTTRFTAGWPETLGGRAVAGYFLGVLLIALGLAILFEKRTRAAALCLAAVIGVSLVFFHVRGILAKPGFGAAWTGPAKYLSLLGGALLIARMFRAGGERPNEDVSPVSTFAPRLFLSAFLILCGIQHYVYLKFVANFVPAWIPNRVFWACFAGIALIAGGLGLWVPKTARLAGILTGGMIFVWFLIVHIPRAAASPGDPGEWSGVFESLATSGIALMLASTSPSPKLREAIR
jgi:uncharacterized membrane protein